MRIADGGSSSGRTAVFGAVNRGSNPRPPVSNPFDLQSFHFQTRFRPHTRGAGNVFLLCWKDYRCCSSAYTARWRLFWNVAVIPVTMPTLQPTPLSCDGRGRGISQASTIWKWIPRFRASRSARRLSGTIAPQLPRHSNASLLWRLHHPPQSDLSHSNAVNQAINPSFAALESGYSGPDYRSVDENHEIG